MPAFIIKPADFDRNGANVAGLTNVTGTNFGYAQLDFDATTQEHADINLVMDEFYNASTIYIDLFWKAAAIAGDVVWQANMKGTENAEQWDSALGSDNWVSSTVQGTTEYMTRATITVATPGLEARDATVIRISRDADSTHATDNMAGDAKLLLVVVRFNVVG
jgi:hypothetical protein